MTSKQPTTSNANNKAKIKLNKKNHRTKTKSNSRFFSNKFLDFIYFIFRSYRDFCFSLHSYLLPSKSDLKGINEVLCCCYFTMH